MDDLLADNAGFEWDYISDDDWCVNALGFLSMYAA